MSRACDLGPGDVWGSPPDDVNRCECGIEIEEDDACLHSRCAECRDAFSCCETCSVCHRPTDEFEVDEGVDPVCVDCLVARQEAEEDQRERDECALEDKGDEMREAW